MACSPHGLRALAPTRWEYDDAHKGLSVGVLAEIVYSALGPATTRDKTVKSCWRQWRVILRRVDRDALAREFDHRAIEYFYEPFLRAFDPKLRDQLGVWYTPREIARYQVAQADHHLRTALGLEDGLADPSVVVLDPAVGTGTYLAEVYDFLFTAYIRQTGSETEASAHLSAAARTRIAGFEILPAALLIADLHLRRLLRSMGSV